MLNYDYFQVMIEAQKELIDQVGTKDIAFITDLMDIEVEAQLLWEYGNWIYNERQAVVKSGLGTEENTRKSEFLKGLAGSVCTEQHRVLFEDLLRISQRHGKTWQEMDEVTGEVRRLTRKDEGAALRLDDVTMFY